MKSVIYGALCGVVTAIPATMDAFVAHDYVGTDFSKIKIETKATPRPAMGQVLIEVKASSVNPIDWKIVDGDLKTIFPVKFPTTLGFDLAGTVVEVGAGVQRLKVGDAVWADLGFDMHAYAEYAVANESIVAIAPKALTAAEAAVLPLVSLTGYDALVTYGKAPWAKSANKTVLITAGQGGTGLVGIQLAKAWGAQTVITSASTENVALMRKLGADVVVDYTKQSIWDVVPDNSVDVLYENLGAPNTADKGLAKVRTGGEFVYIAGNAPSTTKTGVGINFFLCDSSHYEHLEAIRDVVDKGELKPLISTTYQFKELAAAFAANQAGGTIGKIAINVGPQ